MIEVFLGMIFVDGIVWGWLCRKALGGNQKTVVRMRAGNAV
jgi:hypothetical protein